MGGWGDRSFEALGKPLESFEYTAVNPLVVNRPINFNVARVDQRKMRVWAEDAENGTVGMVGEVCTPAL